jgi:TPR repeat protein
LREEEEIMDDPFDADGGISETARIVFDTDNYLAVSGQAKKGDADAQYQLGQWHYEGGNEAVEKDDAKAAEWFRRAAEQGHTEAQQALEAMSDRLIVRR